MEPSTVETMGSDSLVAAGHAMRATNRFSGSGCIHRSIFGHSNQMPPAAAREAPVPISIICLREIRSFRRVLLRRDRWTM